MLPETRVEFAVDGLDLEGILLATLVGGLEDVDTLDGGEASAEHSGPSKSNGVAGGGFNGENVEANGGLATLAGNECSLAGEGGATKRIW